jgi:peptide/nickel transport system permease protein
LAGGRVLRFIARRLGLALLTCWVISVMTFIIIQLPPGDAATAYMARLAADGVHTNLELSQIRHQFGLDEPLYRQYIDWMTGLLHGNMGTSLDLKRPVSEVIFQRMPLTITVSLVSEVLTFVVALPIGIYAAVRRYSLGDYITTVIGFFGLAVPNFLLALALMYFGLTLFGISVGGLFSQQFVTAPWSIARFLDLCQHLIVPSIALGLGGVATLTRIMRANLLDEMGKPYVTTARAKGLSERRAIAKYPVRVALNPFASGVGFLLPQIVSGGIIVAVVLSLPTVGPLLLSAILDQDMFMAGDIILILGIFTVIGTLISDLILMWLDPRIRHVG